MSPHKKIINYAGNQVIPDDLSMGSWLDPSSQSKGAGVQTNKKLCTKFRIFPLISRGYTLDTLLK